MTTSQLSIPAPAGFRALSGAIFLTLLPCTASAQEWFQENTSAAPEARRFHSLTYDHGRKASVLFGGIDEKRSKIFSDTWVFDGAIWRRELIAGPGGRQRHAACYDEADGRLLLFGGLDATGRALNDTWEFDGKKWRAVPTKTVPSPRFSIAMSYDARRGRIVMFGGLDAASNRLAETWEFDGRDWVEVKPAVAPPARHGHSQIYHKSLGATVLFGGFADNNRVNSETWEWDGTNWREAKPAFVPPTLVLPAMVYNPFHQVAVVVGGQGALGQPPLTFAYDGKDWGPGPSAPSTFFGRIGQAMSFDTARDAAVLFGGASVARGGAAPRDDTWKLSTQAVFEEFGAGCATSAGTLALASADRPRLGGSVDVEVTNGPAGWYRLMVGASRTKFLGMDLPLELRPYGMPGCRLLVSISTTIPMRMRGKVASARLDVPLDPQLLGGVLYLQGLTSGSEAATSNAARLVIGN